MKFDFFVQEVGGSDIQGRIGEEFYQCVPSVESIKANGNYK